ncbi:MAG: Asp-tRNA(Asn)/Glu-tRNA(Gln) amidotransferase subunit GatC [Verrucomicrobia bacterium]|nr:Asp-tRNA(Asn)/Glu-tRNA(Gln) amidotransferase subunit GatC [Verrucomicrobiota bacterium]
MSLLNEEEFIKLTKLCRIQCSSDEKELFLQKIQRVISYMALLDEIDTKDTPPCYQVVPSLSEVTREDIEGPLLSREEFLSNAPSHIGGMIKVPTVMKTSN